MASSPLNKGILPFSSLTSSLPSSLTYPSHQPFRQPHEGEVVKTMNCGEIISLMQKDYPSLQNTVGNKVKLGKAISALGFKHKDHSHIAYYEVVPLKAA